MKTKENEESITTGKFTHTQLMFIFSTVTACIGLPALLLFHLDEKLFLEIEIWKLLLLCFGISSPVLCSIFGYAWLDGEIFGKKQKISASIYIAIVVTILVYLLCIGMLALGKQTNMGVKPLFLLPMMISWATMQLMLFGKIILYMIKKKKHESPTEPPINT
jgi:hypothetical protein